MENELYSSELTSLRKGNVTPYCEYNLMSVREKFITIIIIGFSIFLVDMSTDILLPSLELFKQVFDLDLKQAQLLLSINLMGFAIASLISGVISDLYGRKRVFLLGVLIFTGASILLCLVDSFKFLVFFRLIQGIGGGTISALALAIFNDAFNPKDFVKALSFMGMLISTSPAVSPFIGVFLRSNWKYSFILTGLLAALNLFFILFFISKKLYVKKPKRLKSSLFYLLPYYFCFFKKKFMLYNLISGFSYAILWVFLAYLPYYFIVNNLIKTYQVGLIFFPAVSFGISGMYLNTKLIKVITIYKSLLVGIYILTFAVTILFVSVIFNINNSYYLILVIAIYWFSSAFIFPNASQLALESLEDEYSGTGSSLLIFTEIILGTIMIGLVSLYFNDSILILASFALGITCIILSLTLLLNRINYA